MQFVVLAVTVLVPLIITPNLLFYFDVTPKIVVLLFGAAACLVLYRKKPLPSGQGRWFVIILACQWIWLLISALLSSHMALSIQGSTWRRYGLLTQTGLLIVAFAAMYVPDRPLLIAMTCAGIPVALYGVLQYFGIDSFLPPASYHVGEGVFTIVRPPGTLGHADYFAAWLVIVVFCGLALARMETGPGRLIAMAVAILSSFAIVLSGTRAALLGLAVGAIVWIVQERPKLRPVPLIALVAALTAFILSPAGLKLRARVHWSTEDVRGGARLLLWRDSLRLVGSHPVVGIGPEAFVTEFPRYESAELARAYPDFYHESPHNAVLDAAAGEGIPGALLLLALYVVGMRPARGALAGALSGAVICQQFGAFTLPTALYFYLAAGIACRTGPPFVQLSQGTWYRVPAFAGACLLAVFAAELLLADRAMQLAQNRIEAEDVPAATVHYHSALHRLPWSNGLDLPYSRRMAALAAHSPVFRTRLDAYSQAMEAGIRAASEADDRHNAWYNLAELMAARDDLAGTERSLRNAIAWAPNWFKPHWMLARLLKLANRPQDALGEARLAMDLNGGKDAEVTQTFTTLLQVAH